MYIVDTRYCHAYDSGPSIALHITTAHNILHHFVCAFQSNNVTSEDLVPLVNKWLFSSLMSMVNFFYAMYLKKILLAIRYRNLKIFSLFLLGVDFENNILMESLLQSSL